MIDKETGYDFQGMSELELDINLYHNAKAIDFYSNLLKKENPEYAKQIEKLDAEAEKRNKLYEIHSVPFLP